MPLLTSSSAMATEGTSEWFGVDDIRLLAVFLLGTFLLLQFGSNHMEIWTKMEGRGHYYHPQLGQAHFSGLFSLNHPCKLNLVADGFYLLLYCISY